MKHLLRLSFFIAFFQLNGQVDHVKIEKNSNPLVPSIAGYTEGDIPYFLLCDSLGIQSASGYKVKEFKISYKGEEFDVKGRVVPDSVCVYIGGCNDGQIVFFTEIYAENDKAQLIKLYPFNLMAVKDED